MKPHPSYIKIFDVQIDNVTMPDALHRAQEFLEGQGSHAIATVNPEFLMRARTDAAFCSVLNRASLKVPDGIGIRFVCWLRGIRMQERVTGADLLIALAALAQTEQKRVFLFGAADGVARAAADALLRKFPTLTVAGAENEYDEHGKRRSDDEELKRIANAKPDILFVALGSPKQEFWIDASLRSLPSVRIAVGVGGSFEYLTGRLPRAPKIFQRLWLEWLWRVLLQPSRWKRIVTAAIRFPLAVLRTPNAITTEEHS